MFLKASYKQDRSTNHLQMIRHYIKAVSARQLSASSSFGDAADPARAVQTSSQQQQSYVVPLQRARPWLMPPTRLDCDLWALGLDSEDGHEGKRMSTGFLHDHRPPGFGDLHSQRDCWWHDQYYWEIGCSCFCSSFAFRSPSL